MAAATQVQVVRAPLVGSHTTRVAIAVTSPDASGIVGLGVVGEMIVGFLTTSDVDQRFLNAIPDKITNNFTESTKFYVYKRPGFVVHNTPAAGNIGTAIKLWSGQGNGDKIITAYGDTNSTIYDGTSSLGAIVGTARDITETIIGTTATLVIPSSNSRAYYYPDGGALTEITDVDYPFNAGLTTVGTFVHLDGYAFIMTSDGNIWNSDLNSVANWTSTSFIATNMYPDKGVGLARYKDTIVAFGKETIEFFRDVGNDLGSPLQKINEAFIKLGAIDDNAICQFEDSVAFVASSDISSISVFVLDGFKPIRVSDNVIDSLLANRGSATIRLTAAKVYGKTLLFLVVGPSTFVYSLEDKMWHEWAGVDIKWHKFAANTSATPITYSISSTNTDGAVYAINPVAPVFDDDGDAYTMSITTSKIDLDTERRKFLHRVTVVGDTSLSSTNLSISWSDDDYMSFSTPRDVDLNSGRKYISNCGSFRRRAFRLTNSDPVGVRLEALEMEITQGQT